MKNYFTFSFILSLALFCVKCNKSQLVEITNTGNDYVSLSIHGHENVNPIHILSGKTEGAIYFETDEGKTWLGGDPDEIISKANEFKAKWVIEERTIVVDFKLDNGKCQFSFLTQPNADILKWGIQISATEEEYFTGLFERVVDGDQKESWKEGITEAMNLRGQDIDMIIKPTLSMYCPFYLSSNGYGLFINGTWPGHYDICKTDPGLVKIDFEGPSLSGIFYFSDHPAEIVKAHSLHVGPTIIPPEWAFFPWRWRDNHTNSNTYYDGSPANVPYNSELVEDVLMMQALDIPCGVYWVDRPWALGKLGYADFEWNPEQFPEAENMIEWLHSNNMKFLLWIAPWVTGNMKTEAEQNGYAQAMKNTHHNIDSSKVALLDFTNPEACKWWQTNGIEKMLKQGVDGFKLDRAEETVPETRDILLSDGRTAREVRNEYPVLYVKTVNESCKKIHGDDFVLIPRAGYTGSSRYSGFWGGDIGSPPEGLRAAIIALQRCAIMGYPIWGSDIGGYWQADLDREVCARWLAFGCFNPIMEFGPTEDRAPWNMDSEPHYDTTLIAIWRMYAKIHTSLAVYSHNLAKEANESGMPVARPLFLEYPEQKECWSDWQTFLYGSDILVSAIWEKDITTHSCYLPAGHRWKDAWDTDKIYEGGQYIKIETPLHKIPIFIRENSEIDLGDLQALYQESLEIAKNKPKLQELEKKFISN